MTHPLAELIGDIRDCASRARDLDQPEASGDLYQLANELEGAAMAEKRQSSRPPPVFPPERPSYPAGTYEANQPTRKTAKEHFRKAREHTAEAIRRLRRES
jgi:hypothetical protein